MMIDVSDETLEQDVLVRSEQVPVVVDLWAPWCGPCKQLGPLLERAVEATNGQVVLAKVNVDDNPNASQMFQVQGIPAVFAIKDKQVVDSFVGARGEDEVNGFVAALVPEGGEAPPVSEIAQLIALGDETSLRSALEIEVDNEAATLGLAAILAESERGEEALALLTRIPETAESRRIAALVRAGDDAGGDIEQKLTDLLDRVKGDDDARQSFVDLLEIMGPDDPRTAQWRKKLTARLF